MAIGESMRKPNFSEAQLEILLECFFDEFTSFHGANTSKLGEYAFSVINRDTHAEAAQLNFSYLVAVSDGKIVRMHNSGYVDAVKSLAQRGLVNWMPNKPLAFNLTLQGYEKISNKRMRPIISKWAEFMILLNNHNGFIAVVSAFIGFAGGFFIAWYFK